MAERGTQLPEAPASAPRRLVSIVRSLGRGERQRREAWVRLRRPHNLFQPFAETSLERYPEIFDTVAGELRTPAPRLLSFGCSSGEELVSLWRRWPEAEVRGVDINGHSVRAARRLLRTAGAPARVSVVRGGDVGSEEPGSFDAVFALAVFRHGHLNHAPASCAPLLRFADFDRAISELAALVRPSGVLAIGHANFRFGDTAAATGFHRLPMPPEFGPGNSPVYSADDQLAASQERDDGVWRRAEVAEIDGDLSPSQARAAGRASRRP